MEKVKWALNYEIPEAYLFLARASLPKGSLLPEVVDELPSEPNPTPINKPQPARGASSDEKKTFFLLHVFLLKFFFFFFFFFKLICLLKKIYYKVYLIM